MRLAPLKSTPSKLISSGGHETKYLDDLINPTSNPWPRYGLYAEDSFVAEINTEGASEIVLVPVLLGEGDTDKKKFTCEESSGRKVTVF